ncbi:MAG: hypothetical protein ACLVKO_01485 [Dysgonomonas sp.]
MKKTVYLQLLLFTIVLLSGCSKPLTPGETIKRHVEWLNTGEYEKYIDKAYFYTSERGTEEYKEEKKHFSDNFDKFSRGFYDTHRSRGTTMIVDIISEDIEGETDEEKEANVKYKITFSSNGQSFETKAKLYLQNGEWRIKQY